MDTHGMNPTSENSQSDQHAAIALRADFCMQHYQPYIRKDFNLHQLSVIANIPVSSLADYFSQSPLTFNQYLDVWRVKYAKMLITTGKARDMKIGTIGSLSGFSSVKKFTAAYTEIEGISPEICQSQINTSKSL